MADVDPSDPSTQTSPFFAAASKNTVGLSTTQDDALTNQQINKIATDLGSQNADLVAAIDAISAAINAKPSA